MSGDKLPVFYFCFILCFFWLSCGYISIVGWTLGIEPGLPKALGSTRSTRRWLWCWDPVLYPLVTYSVHVMLIFKKVISFHLFYSYVYECFVYICLCTVCVQYPQISGNWSSNGCESCRFWEWNSGPLEEQSVHLITKPSLQSHVWCF